MLFVKKGKKKVFVQIKQLPPDERSLPMKILRANSVPYGWENCFNHHFEIPNPLEYWFEDPALPSFEEINQEQNTLDSLPDLKEDRDTSFLDWDDETDSLHISDENDD